MQDYKSTYHLSMSPKLYEPMRNNTFELVVEGLDDLVRAGKFVGDGNIYGAQELIRLSVNKVNVPNFTQSIIEIQRGNTKLKFAGTMSFDTGSIEVIDYIGADSRSILMAWQKLSGDIEKETVGRAADYKKNCTLIEYTPDFEQVRAWKIYGAWVASVPTEELSNEGGNDKRVMSAQLVFDKMVLDTTDSQIDFATTTGKVSDN